MRRPTLSGTWSLPPEEVHIHVLRKDDGDFPEPPEDLFCLLPSEELERSGGFEREEARREFLWSRLLVRRVLSSYLGREMRDLNFGYEDYGKPFLKDSEVQFNLSHTDGLIACSVARRRMGIDVEKMAEGEKKGRNWRLLVERFFSMDEKKYLSSHDLENQNRIFYRIFTMKEAVLKATGSGLNRFSENVSVPLTMAKKISGDGWDYFVKFFEPGGFCLSHAAENRDCPPKYRLFEWAESFFENRFKFDSPNLMEGTYGHLHG